MDGSRTATPSGPRRALLVLATALISFGMVEAAAFATLQIARQRAPERFVRDWDAYVAGIDQQTIDHLNESYFDGILGWDFQPGFSAERRNSRGDPWTLHIDGAGSRRDPHERPGEPVQIATYGDSFTFCDEVNDDQTWQSGLSEILGVNVANFGVAGYGPDQMLLKYETATWPAASPKIVMLSIYEGDLNRALTRFYPFYATDSQQFLGFKPRFVLKRGMRLRLIASPTTAPVRDRADLRRLIDAARDHDVWYERRVELGFPYTLGALKLARLLPMPAYGRPWQSQDETELLRAIIDRFVAVTRARDDLPVLMFIPRVELWRGGRRAPPYQSFVAGLRAERPDLLTIDVAEASFDLARFNIVPFGGHASPYGNRVIARHAAEFLQPLLAGRDEPALLTKD